MVGDRVKLATLLLCHSAGSLCVCAWRAVLWMHCTVERERMMKCRVCLSVYGRMEGKKQMGEVSIPL